MEVFVQSSTSGRPMMLSQCLSMLVTIEKAQTLECGCHKLYIYPFKLHSEL